MSSNQIQNASAAPGGIERRKHSRHRFIVDLNISSENGTSMHGMSFEIGAGGMSAATAGRLEVGEQVLLYPVIRARVKAIVRRKNGSMYGALNSLCQRPSFRKRLWLCARPCPLFQTMADI